MIRRSGALALLIAAVACVPAAAAPIHVNVRVEGKHRTLFEGKVTTSVHKVDSHDGSGSHTCDGTNGGANDTPAPTLLSSFDTAMLQAHIAWRGEYFPDFEDFGIDKVGPDASDTKAGDYWGQALNYKDTELGGCQLQVGEGAKVLVAYDSFGNPKLLLRGPKHAKAGKRFRLTVIDGETGKPFEGARVRGKTTDAKGHVKVKFASAGTHGLKARAKDAVRSNRLKVKVREDD
jgi:hypothetical protein